MRGIHLFPEGFYIFFDVNLKKELNKQLICWWFEKAWYLFMWCHCLGASMCNINPCAWGLHHCYQSNNISMGLSSHFCAGWPGLWFNIKMSPYHYRKSHCVNKTAIRSFNLLDGISYADKMSSSYRIRALGWCTVCFVTLNSSQIKSKFLTLIWGNLLCNKTLPLVWSPGIKTSSDMILTYFRFIIHYTQNVNILHINFYRHLYFDYHII